MPRHAECLLVPFRAVSFQIICGIVSRPAIDGARAAGTRPSFSLSSSDWSDETSNTCGQSSTLEAFGFAFVNSKAEIIWQPLWIGRALFTVPHGLARAHDINTHGAEKALMRRSMLLSFRSELQQQAM